MTAIAAATRASRNTHSRLILATERLIARHGVEGVSMRQIGQAAGMGNNSGVQYHFGTKERLIEAVLAYRQPFLDARRRELLEQVQARGAPSTRDILEILLRPLTELVDEDGEHVYAQFIWQLRRADLLGELPIHLQTLSERDDELPRLLMQALGHPALPAMGLVIRSAFAMFLFMLISRDKQSGASGGFDLEVALQLGVDMVEAALAAATRAVAAGKAR